MADDTTEPGHLAATDQDMVIEEGAFLDEWSVAQEVADRDDVTDVVRVADVQARNVDDIHRTGWVDDVVETASSVILELLDTELSEADDRDIDDDTLQDLHNAIAAESLPPSAPFDEDSEPDTQEIELLEEELDDKDPFGATGIQFVDVDTGEVLETTDVPYLETGFHLIEESEGSGPSQSQAFKNLGLRLAAIDDELPLPEPWGRLLAELRDEILAEPDVRIRAAILFLFGQIVRSLGSDDAMTEPLQDLAPVAGAVTRSGLLDRLATQWDRPGDEFFSLLRRLERLDDHDEGSVAAVRRAAIATERLLDGDVDDATRAELRDLVTPPETFAALVARAAEGHAWGNRNQAVEAWERLSRYAKGELASAAIAIVGWLLQGTHGFFEVATHLLDEGWNSRCLLLIMQRESVRVGDRLQEARALKRLVGLDVHLGKRLPDEGASRRRLKSETAARLVRLSTLLEGLPRPELDQTEMASMDSYSVLCDAISLHARNPLYLRRLVRIAVARGDLDMAEKGLISLASVIEEPPVRAVVWEELASLIERSGGSPETVHEYLERSLDAAPDCLPALISMGQHLIGEDSYERMLSLRSGPDGEEPGDMNLAWRRAELLERTGGDPMEILSLYRDARDDHPSSVHLFFCVERALARLADWRGLRTLYDSASAPESELADQLKNTGLGVEQYRLAVEVFLEDAYGDLSDAMLRFVEGSPTASPDDDTRELRVDQNVLWRVVAREIESDPGRAMGRLEVLLRAGEGDAPWRKRALVWYGRLVEDSDRAEQAMGAYREVFERARGTFLRRWAVRGLLRTGDAAWVARQMVDDATGDDWARPEQGSAEFRRRLAAELMYLSANPDDALDIFESLELDDDVARAEVAERATVQAIRSRRWVRAIPWMMRCYPSENRPALAEIARHLGASFDDASEALRYVDASGTETPADPYVILCELELAYRARDWKRALRLIEQGLGTIAAGSIDFRAFLLEQAVLIAEWGKRSNELSLTFLEDLWSLDPTVGSSPIYSVSAFLRTFTRMNRREDFEEYAEYVRTNFTPSVAESLLGESRVYDEATDGASAAQWYAARVDNAPQPLQPYYEWMAVVLRWMFGERDRTSVQDLADATAAGDPTHRVGPFLLAIAYRHADMYASCERQLAVLRTPGYSRPVQDWVLVRSLFHLAVTQNQTADALDRIREDEAFAQFGWYAIAEELFARAVRDEAVVDVLQERAKISGGARSLELEIAEISGDRRTIHQLADDGFPEAVAQSEMAAARGEATPLPQWDIDQRYQQVRRSIEEDEPDVARSTVMDYFLDIDEELLGTPWCPLRLVRGDLTRFSFELSQLDRLRNRFVEFEDPEMGAEARLLVARQFLRVGRRHDAYGLMPDSMGPQLVCVAWSLFNFALDPFTRDEKSNAWALDFWERRREGCVDALEAEVEYEIGRYLEMIGRPQSAIDAFRRALSHAPRFLPAQVAAGRLLIRSEDWRGLASLWEAEMQFTEDVEALAGVAFRLGYLWERRLGHLPDSEEHADEAYRRVLRVRPNHFPTLHALLELSFRRKKWGAVEQYLARIVEACPDDQLRVSYLCDLASVREYHLEDLGGALDAYRAAFDTNPDSVDALFGILRTDHEGAAAVASIRERLKFGVTQRELRDLGHHLFAATQRHSQADEIIQNQIPTHYGWLVSRIIRGAEYGEHDTAAAEALRSYNPDESTKLLLASFERVLTERDPDGPRDLDEAIRAIGTNPNNEGKLVAAMHYAGRRRDLEALGMLAAVRARRSNSDILRCAELTWMAATLMLRDEWADALDIAEQLLQQVPDFMPAIKIAKFAADVARDWESVVRWFQRDAAISRSDEVASADRLYASEVQREHLGDFDAALEQLGHVLEREPTHDGAFEKVRDILLTKGEHRKLLAAYESRVEHTDDDDRRAELLNEMGDIALNHLRDRRAAIGYFGRSLEIKPRQLRRLRVLSELYENEKRWDRAVVCHRAAAELIDDPIFLARLWRHVGHLYEKRLENLKKARNAYARALKHDGDSTEVLVALARVCERLDGYQDALTLLDKVKLISRDSRVLLDARIGIARLRNKLGAPAPKIVEAIRDVLVHHPGHKPSVEAAQNALVSAGAGEEVSAFFQRITHDTIQLHGVRALAPVFSMALQLGHRDRAFCLAAIGDELGHASQQMKEFRRKAMQQRRWPSRPIPSEEAGAVLPGGLVAPFVELLRLSRGGLFEGLDGLPGAGFIKKGTRLKEPKNKATQLAFNLPQLMSLKLRDVHLADEVPGGSVALFDGGVRLVLDRRWTKVTDPTEPLVQLGERLAAWSMGIGPWAALDIDTQVSLFIAIVSNYVRGWAHAERSHLPQNLNYPRVQRWLERKGQRVAPYAMEISGRFGSAAIRQQFELLAQARKRMACLLVDDAGRALAAAGLLQEPEPGDKPDWLFVLDAPAATIRKKIGVAFP
jgi:tetratricopeptide (TPR) repeat protein